VGKVNNLYTNRGRGRPPKRIVPLQRVFTARADLAEVKRLAAAPSLANLPRLPDGTAPPTEALAKIALMAIPITEMWLKASKTGPGARPCIDIGIVLRDCARLYETVTGEPTEKSLKRMAEGYRETPSKKNATAADRSRLMTMVEKWARAVLEASFVKGWPGELRRRRAQREADRALVQYAEDELHNAQHRPANSKLKKMRISEAESMLDEARRRQAERRVDRKQLRKLKPRLDKSVRRQAAGARKMA